MGQFVYRYRSYPLATRLEGQKARLNLPIVSSEEGRAIRPWLRDVLGPGSPYSFVRGARQWEVPRSRLAVVRDAIVERYGICDVDLEAKISAAIQCDDRCQEAEGPDCTCSCGGEFHGVLHTSHNWVRVGDTTLISWTTTTQTRRTRFVRSDLRHFFPPQ